MKQSREPKITLFRGTGPIRSHTEFVNDMKYAADILKIHAKGFKNLGDDGDSAYHNVLECSKRVRSYASKSFVFVREPKVGNYGGEKKQ